MLTKVCIQFFELVHNVLGLGVYLLLRFGIKVNNMLFFQVIIYLVLK